MPENLFRCLRGDFLDVDSARRAGHEDGTLGGSIDDDADVSLTGDVSRRRDENFLDWQSLDPQFQDLSGNALRFLRSACELDPARLTTPTRVDLRLHHDRCSKLARSCLRLVRRRSNLARWNW